MSAPSPPFMQPWIDCPSEAAKSASVLASLHHALGDAGFATFLRSANNVSHVTELFAANPWLLTSTRNLMSLFPSAAAAPTAPTASPLAFDRSDPITEALAPIQELMAITGPSRQEVVRDKMEQGKERLQALTAKYRDSACLASAIGLVAILAKGMTDWMTCHELAEATLVKKQVQRIKGEMSQLLHKGAESKTAADKLSGAERKRLCTRPTEAKLYVEGTDWDLVEWVRLRLLGQPDAALTERAKGRLEAIRDHLTDALQEGVNQMRQLLGGRPASSQADQCLAMRDSLHPGYLAMDTLYNLVNDPEASVPAQLVTPREEGLV